jgi:hypothetical protein
VKSGDAVEVDVPTDGLVLSTFTKRHPGCSIDVVVGKPRVESGGLVLPIASAVRGATKREAEELKAEMQTSFGRPASLHSGIAPTEWLVITDLPAASIKSPVVRLLAGFLDQVPKRASDGGPRIVVHSAAGKYQVLLPRGDEGDLDLLAEIKKGTPRLGVRVRYLRFDETDRSQAVLAAWQALGTAA